MQLPVPFEGFELLSVEYLAILFVGTAALAVLLTILRPPVTQTTVLAFVPWMMSGAALHVLYQLGQAYGVHTYPAVVRPLFSAPAVYLTTFLGLGLAWAGASVVGFGRQSQTRSRALTDTYFGLAGFVVALALVFVLALQGLDPVVGAGVGLVARLLPLVGIIVAGGLTLAVYVLIGAWRTYILAEARYVGALVIFAHALDGVTTTIGTDVLGVAERSVLPQRIMEFAAGLPTAPFLGTGWLFLAVKLALAVAIVVGFADYVRDEPTRGNLFFAFVAAVGFGPAMNNVFLFALGAY